MTLTQLSAQWQDTEESHARIERMFSSLVDKNEALSIHRYFVERGYGFGERSFWHLWKLICEEMPPNFSFLELGCYKGGTLSLIKMLRPDAIVHTVTPLSGEGGYGDSNYEQDVRYIHDHFGLSMPGIIQGLSTEGWVVQAVRDLGYWDVIYVDGGHDTETVLSDLNNYAPLVKHGGYLVMDDCNSEMSMPHGYFQGHQSVTDAKLKWLETQIDFEFICSVVHISVFRRK